MRPTLAPAGDRVHLELEVRRLVHRHEPTVRRLEDRVNGTVHLPDRVRQTTRADLDLAPGGSTSLPAGTLPDGRAVVLDVRVAR